MTASNCSSGSGTLDELDRAVELLEGLDTDQFWPILRLMASMTRILIRLHEQDAQPADREALKEIRREEGKLRSKRT